MYSMDLVELITNSVSILTNDNDFYISELIIDENNFGNIVVILKSNYGICVRFIKDRGDCWSEIGFLNEWYFLEDVCCAIGINIVPSSTDLEKMITDLSHLIKKNMLLIIKSFDAKNHKKTQAKIKEIARKRAMNMFDLDQ